MTDDGIKRLANELQPSKAQFSMLVTDDGIARLANELHPSKALCPMLVTDDGMVTRVTLVLSIIQFTPSMLVVPFGMAKCTVHSRSNGSAASADADFAAVAILGRLGRRQIKGTCVQL